MHLFILFEIADKVERERERARMRKRKREILHLMVISHCLQQLGLGPEQSQNMETSFGSPMWVTGTNY